MCARIHLQTQPVEAVFRSMLLVLMDNASAEFTFIVRFFASSSSKVWAHPLSRSDSVTDLNPLSPPSRSAPLSRKESMISVSSDNRGSPIPDGLQLNLKAPDTLSDSGRDPLLRVGSPMGRRESALSSMQRTKQTMKDSEAVFKQVMETAIEYCQVRSYIRLYPGRDKLIH